MGYYCTVPQCTSLAGKTKNVKFHRFPRDVNMADKWNVILKRGKPYTKYSKVCSLHFTQADYNVTTMGKNKGQWKTLSKDAVPSQNLPKLNPDGTVMVIRKSRTVKYKDSILKKESELNGDKPLEHKWPITLPIHYEGGDAKDHEHPALHTDHSSAFRLQHLSNLANNLPPAPLEDATKREKQDVHIQTDPQSEEDKTYSDTNSSMNSEQVESYHNSYGKDNNFNRTRNEYEIPKDYTKANDDYIPQTNEEYNKEAEKYALERKSHYEKDIVAHSYKSIVNYPKVPQDMYSTDFNRDFADKQQEYQSRTFDHYQPSHAYNTDALRGQQQQQLNQQQTTTMLSEHRDGDSTAIFNENQIKQENDGLDDDKYSYERSEAAIASTIYAQQRIMQQRLMEQAQQVKTEPDAVNGCDSVMQPQGSPYYTSSGHVSLDGYYGQYSRAPGPELLIAKQNSLAAHSQLWRDGGKRPLLYGEPRAALAARYDDYTRIIQ